MAVMAFLTKQHGLRYSHHMTANELREKYLRFFASRGHAVIPSASLLPANDPTTLFTGSGMQPLTPCLLGAQHPKGARIADSQKCFRAEDIEEVGDNRHTTFFEMLGNWSLGDYFKCEQIPWIFEFVTKELGLDPRRLYVTVFRGNEEFKLPKDSDAAAIWKETFAQAGIEAKDVDGAERDGMQEGRIFYYPDTKNWWSRAGVPGNMPVGEPGGPDSEMFWDFGPALRLHEESVWRGQLCHMNCDCGRFMEIGNSVFMMYVKREKGFEELPHKNIDFGGGLERLAAALNDNPDMFLIDAFAGVREMIERMSGKRYGTDPEETRAFRVIMDHLRGATFLIADGAKPSNKEQGYFTRRLVRRSVRFAHRLGIQGNFCGEIAKAVIEEDKQAYPNLETGAALIVEALEREEEQFRKTLDKGLKEFERATASGVRSLDGTAAFDLYQTYGFPLELIQEVAAEKGIPLRKEEIRVFQNALRAHQDLSRAGAEQKFKGGLADHSEATTKLHTANHLLLKALQTVLGPQVKQLGSNITGERLRIDFSYGA